ncbi:predicted protein [Plenodomus lingam JN3]|uniref:Predicted protein n=1 Tax=Leptosphaeria maculans (strain JN3 / isolate v23.1.3 / race Av1-4-5-6-7-8) TaxID=985895 RepID=E4ZXL3_LEPMJ|nr:predicted protein [Plenodomus lingam JN3]CBX96108.1 predicted protein [Plenodomus lingam JN3]
MADLAYLACEWNAKTAGYQSQLHRYIEDCFYRASLKGRRTLCKEFRPSDPIRSAVKLPLIIAEVGIKVAPKMMGRLISMTTTNISTLSIIEATGITSVTAVDSINDFKSRSQYIGTPKTVTTGKGDAGVIVDTETKVYGTEILSIVNASICLDPSMGKNQAIVVVAAEAAPAAFLPLAEVHLLPVTKPPQLSLQQPALNVQTYGYWIAYRYHSYYCACQIRFVYCFFPRIFGHTGIQSLRRPGLGRRFSMHRGLEARQAERVLLHFQYLENSQSSRDRLAPVARTTDKSA